MSDKCNCVDCGGTEPTHSKDCEYMDELHRDDEAVVYDPQYATDDTLN